MIIAAGVYSECHNPVLPQTVQTHQPVEETVLWDYCWMKVTLRLAVIGDVERLRDIEVDAGARFRSVGLDVIADDEPPTAEALIAYVEHGAAWVAESTDGLVVGYATASIVDHEGHLDQVSLIGAAAGHGIGRLLIDKVCEWTQVQGIKTVTLTTFRGVAWNGPYYARMGFVGIEPTKLGPELAAIRSAEQQAGIEVSPRIAMRKQIS
jgi:GNAT superfamily N-acetyltransferase